MAVDFFCDVTISQTWKFLIRVYLGPFVSSFAVKLVFIMTGLEMMFTIKVWCQFHPHSLSQSFNGNCTAFTKGLCCIGR